MSIQWNVDLGFLKSETSCFIKPENSLCNNSSKFQQPVRTSVSEEKSYIKEKAMTAAFSGQLAALHRISNFEIIMKSIPVSTIFLHD